MLKQEKKEKKHQKQRMKLWREVYVAYVSAQNSVNKEGGAFWADTALEHFDKRFNNEST